MIVTQNTAATLGVHLARKIKKMDTFFDCNVMVIIYSAGLFVFRGLFSSSVAGESVRHRNEIVWIEMRVSILPKKLQWSTVFCNFTNQKSFKIRYHLQNKVPGQLNFFSIKIGSFSENFYNVKSGIYFRFWGNVIL